MSGSPAALRCCSPLCAPGAQRRGGRLGWNISVRRGRCGWVESGARIYIDEREKIYRFPHVSCSCFMCQQEAEHTPLRHTSRGPAPAAPNSYTRASTRSVFHASLHGRCWHAVFNLSRGRTLGSRPQQTLELRCRFVFSCSDLLSYLLTNLYLYIYLPPPEDRPRPARSLCCTRRGVRGAPIDEHALRPAYIASHLLNLPTRHRGGAICIP